jgi:hypothetical protein
MLYRTYSTKINVKISFQQLFKHNFLIFIDECRNSPTPTSQLLASSLLAEKTLLKTFHRPHFSLYKHSIGITGFLFTVLIIEAGTDRLSQNVGKKLPLLAA